MPSETTVDLSGMSPETRTELEALAKAIGADETPTQTTSPDSSTDTGETPKLEDKGRKPAKSTEPPAWLQEFTRGQQAQTEALTALLKGLEASTRTLHGEVRRQGQQRMQAAPPPTPEGDDPFRALEGSDDPQIAALARAYKAQAARVDALSRIAESSTMSAQEQAERQSWMAFLETQADDLGVSFRDIEPQLRKLSTQDLSHQGMKAITAKAKQTVASAKTDTESADGDVRKLAQQEAIRLLQSTAPGLWEVIRGGLADTSTEVDALDKLNKAIASGRASQDDIKQAKDLRRKIQV